MGVPEIGKEEEGELLHNGFVSLLEDVYDVTKAPYLSPILTYLNELIDRAELAKIIEPRDVVTFSVGEVPYPFERREMYRFWLSISVQIAARMWLANAQYAENA